MKQAAKRGKAVSAGSTARKKPARKQVVKRQSKAELRLERFIAEYLIDLNGRQAAIRAGYSPDTARQTASELLAKPEAQALLRAAQEKVAAALGVSKEMVLDRLNAIATADPRELTELHRGCCRYCWGKRFLFQRTPREMREAKDNWMQDEAARQEKNLPAKAFDEAGGVGFNPKRDPNPACPECFGDGEERVVFKDTRDLSPGARLLFAGVEQTQHGLKIRTHSQPDALVNIGKHLGMFTSKHEHSGPGGGPIQQEHTAVGQLLDLVDGADTGPGAAAGRR
jgi:phage terminase small subunit